MPNTSLPLGAAVERPSAPIPFGSDSMPSRTQRRQRTQQRGQPRLLSLGAWSQVAAGAPDFGAVNPPLEAAAAGMTERVVKDVVRVGRYFLGYDAVGKERYWDITPAVLSQMAANFAAMKANGQRPNLVKTHGDLKSLMVHPDDLMAPIDDIKVAGDTLWMSAYVSPETAKYLQNPARKVSVGSLPNYADSEDRSYPGDSLLHVAVTDRPAVNGQGPFVAMADGASAGGGSMDPEIVDLFNELFGLLGDNPMAEVKDMDDLKLLVRDRIAAKGGSTSEATETEAPAMEGTDPMADSSLDLTGVPAAMQDRIRQQDEKIKTLELQAKTLADREAKATRDRFMADADAAMRTPLNGKIAAKVDVDKAKALADRLKSYDPDIIALIPRTLSAVSQARTLADPNPDGSAPDPDAARKEIAKGIAARRGISLEQALAAVPA